MKSNIKIPKHFSPVSLSELSRTWDRVWHELEKFGFTSRKLETCQVYLGIIDYAYGYQRFGDRPAGRACGDIVLPRVSFSQWKSYFYGMKKESVLDVLRHEYGHAYADVNQRRIETKRFEKVFGGPHDITYSGGVEYNPEYHVTEYAAESTAEDFAELFWKYLKHKGKLPKHHQTNPIIKKWQFIESLRKKR